MIRVVLSFVICGVLALNGCSGESSQASEKLSLTGSSTIAPLMAEIAKRFEANHPGVRIDVQTGGSSRGITDVRGGLVDIGMSSRALKPGEADGVQQHVLAQDGVAFIVHADNAVGELSNDQLLGIFTGKINNWSEVGGSEGEIVVIDRVEGRSELELVTKFFDIKPSQIKADTIAGENQQCVKLVAGNPMAIAYLSVGTAEHEQRRGTPLRALPLDGIEATTASVKAGTFGLGRPLVLVTKPEPGDLVEAFLDFVMSAQVNDLIEGQSFVVPR